MNLEKKNCHSYCQRQKIIGGTLFPKRSSQRNHFNNGVSERELRRVYVDMRGKGKVVMGFNWGDPEQWPSYIFGRGVYNVEKEEVFPNTSGAILPYPTDSIQKIVWAFANVFHKDRSLTGQGWLWIGFFGSKYFGNGLGEDSEAFWESGGYNAIHSQLLELVGITV